MGSYQVINNNIETICSNIFRTFLDWIFCDIFKRLAPYSNFPFLFNGWSGYVTDHAIVTLASIVSFLSTDHFTVDKSRRG